MFRFVRVVDCDPLEQCANAASHQYPVLTAGLSVVDGLVADGVESDEVKTLASRKLLEPTQREIQ